LTSIERFQSASLAPSMSVLTETPALLTRMCSAPSAATISLNAASTAAASATSKRLVVATPPAARTASTASPAAPSLAVKLITTLAPARPSATAMARPMPRDPPVTTAIRPSRSAMAHSLDASRRCGRRRRPRQLTDRLGIRRAVHHDRRCDALDQPGQHAPDADLDRPADTHCAQALDRLLPAHRRGHLAHQQLADP